MPNFIISGAMKSGTTTLHTILNQHPDVFIPEGELHFFDMDNIVQHPDFNVFQNDRWDWHELTKSPEFYWDWYYSQFRGAKSGQLIGEDSTTYLASPLTAKRIASQNKNIKLLIILRQPTARAYSHYWHMLKAGRALYNFEDTLQYSPHNILGRSSYLTQLNILFNYLPKAQVKVVIFEKYLVNKSCMLQEICEFLKLDFERLPESSLDIHVNQAKIPRFINLEVWKTRLFKPVHYFNEMRFPKCKLPMNKCNTLTWFLERFYRFVNPLVERHPPKINPNTEQFLDDYFYKELQGLDELLEQDVMSLWFDKNR